MEAFPLHWPAGYPRTHWPKRSAFDTSFARARNALLKELHTMGARGIVLSSNVPQRRDGLPYANAAEPKDKGVAVYFQLKGKPHVIACDAWDRVQDNFQALYRSVEALRALKPWGNLTNARSCVYGAPGAVRRGNRQ